MANRDLASVREVLGDLEAEAEDARLVVAAAEEEDAHPLCTHLYSTLLLESQLGPTKGRHGLGDDVDAVQALLPQQPPQHNPGSAPASRSGRQLQLREQGVLLVDEGVERVRQLRHLHSPQPPHHIRLKIIPGPPNSRLLASSSSTQL